MSRLTNSIIIEAPADAVWEVVAHRYASIGEWATAIPSSAPSDGTPAAPATQVAGRVCRTNVPLVPAVTETIVSYDESGRTLTYEATAGMPAFVRLARNRWQVTALDAHRSMVLFRAHLEVRGLMGWFARLWLVAQGGRSGRQLLADLKHYVEHGSASPRKRRALTRAPVRGTGPSGTPTAGSGAGSPPVAMRRGTDIGGTRGPGVGALPTTRRLRAALRANAVYSLATGTVLLVLGVPLGIGALPTEAGGVEMAATLAVGVGLICFGVLLVWLAVLPARPLRQGSVLVVAADSAWVAGSIVVVVANPPHWQLSAGVATLAAGVAALAAWQTAGLVVIRGDDPLADLEVVEASHVLAAVPGDVWPLLSDHELYGRLAPNLASVEVISDPDQPLRRRCTNTAGRGWEETCTLWEHGRRFAVEVEVADYPYPLVFMSGLWQVDPHPAGSRVTMRFTYRAGPSVSGGIFAVMLRTTSRLALARIFAGWESSAAEIPEVAGKDSRAPSR